MPSPDIARPVGLLQSLLPRPSREVRDFLLVGGAGFFVDVACFNLLRSIPPWSIADPAFARTLAVAAAICVTYIGNRRLTWRAAATGDRRREVTLFFTFSIIGFGISLLTLAISHDVLGLTSRLADNISANGVGLALGTAFRFLTYKHIVFREPQVAPVASQQPIAPRQPALSYGD